MPSPYSRSKAIMNDNTINATTVGNHDNTVMSKVVKNNGDENKDVSVSLPAQDRTNHKISKKEISDAISNLERYYNRTIRFEIDNDVDMVIVKIIDKESGDVIRQIPSEEFVEHSRKITEHEGHLFEVVA